MAGQSKRAETFVPIGHAASAVLAKIAAARAANDPQPLQAEPASPVRGAQARAVKS